VRVRLPESKLAGTHEAASVETAPGGAAVKKGLELKEKGFIVYLVGLLGNDSNGQKAYEALGAMGFRTDCVYFQNRLPTSTVIISTSADGEESVIRCPGAGTEIGRHPAQDYKWMLPKVDVCFCETPYVEALKQILAETGASLGLKEF
jgi:sugar/nucleoside kinase (ribokinase family)